MRKNGSESNKLCWRVVISIDGNELHNKEYTTLKIAGDELGLTYSQICDLKPNGRNKKKHTAFKFYPKIDITRIEYENQPIN